MSNKIEKVKKLKAVYLEYEDGSVIAVPEEKSLKVGSAFMRVVGKEHFEWRVISLGKTSLVEKIKHFFDI
jgi:hypothetical protein